MRRSWPALAMLLVASTPTIAGYPTKVFYITAKEGREKAQYLAVRDGKLALGPLSFIKDQPWEARPPCGWYILGTQIKSSLIDGGYLAYDPTGKDDRVSLVKEPIGEATEWVITKGELWGKNETTGANHDWARIQASAGPLKGYFLDFERDISLAEGPPADYVVLRKKAAWNVEASRVYRGK